MREQIRSNCHFNIKIDYLANNLKKSFNYRIMSITYIGYIIYLT